MNTYVAATLCVIGMTAGQLLFKTSADMLNGAASALEPRVLAVLCAAVGIYGLTTLGWVWILRFAELGRIYPFMALAFVLVPLASHFVFGERMTSNQWVGSLLILAGIALSAQR